MKLYHKSRIKTITIAIFLIVCLLLPGCAQNDETANPQVSGKLRIFFANVGKGDAALIGTPDEKWIMIDVGHEDEHAEVVRLLKQNDVKELEAIFISHQHKDHYSALADVLSYVSCEVIYTTPKLDYYKQKQRFLDMADDAGVPVKLLNPGEHLDVAGISIDILGPNGTFAEEDDNSLVQMVRWGDLGVLFVGDQRYEPEKALLKTARSIKCDVLKTGNHGRNASSDAFLIAAGADDCIITNNFQGEERDASVAHFASHNMRTYVLGETGTMVCELEDGNISFFENKPPAEQQALSVSISEFDRGASIVSVTNNSGQDVALKGWCLRSIKAKHTYFFADDAVLGKGETLTVSSEVFGKLKKKDGLALYDQYGRELDKAA